MPPAPRPVRRAAGAPGRSGSAPGHILRTRRWRGGTGPARRPGFRFRRSGSDRGPDAGLLLEGSSCAEPLASANSAVAAAVPDCAAPAPACRARPAFRLMQSRGGAHPRPVPVFARGQHCAERVIRVGVRGSSRSPVEARANRPSTSLCASRSRPAYSASRAGARRRSRPSEFDRLGSRSARLAPVRGCSVRGCAGVQLQHAAEGRDGLVDVLFWTRQPQRE